MGRLCPWVWRQCPPAFARGVVVEENAREPPSSVTSRLLHQFAGRQRRDDGPGVRRNTRANRNYLALFAGNTFGLTKNTCPVNGGALPNLGSELRSAGYTFMGFAEGL